MSSAYGTGADLVHYLGSHTVLLVTFCFFATFLLRQRKRSRLPLPPGPKKLPILGNLFQIPTSYQWKTYAKWCKEYNSDIIHIDAAGTSIIVVNSTKVASELFERRSAIYSSRVRTPMLYDLVGGGSIFAFMPYGEAWKERRKLFQQHFHPNNTKILQSCELEYTPKLIRRLLDSPDKFMEHIRFVVGAIIITLAYGLEVHENDDRNLEIAEKAMVGLMASAAPGAFLVDAIPLLKHVPNWMPGAGFKRKAKEWNSWTKDMMEAPFLAAQRAIAGGTAKPSFVSLCLAGLDETSDADHQLNVIRDTAGNFFAGGADTTVSTLNSFILAMTCYPDVQRKAHEELDSVIAKGQLPSFEDEKSLPYISAMVKELIRWRAIGPLGIPHAVTEDDEYNGYFIPKGSIVAGNIWAMTNNEDDYPEPFEYKPERFLKDGKLNPDVRDPAVTFGFGRRVCPGKHIALSTIWITISSILTVYEISPEKDRDGNPILPTQEYIPSLLIHPAPFKCTIRPRSREAEQLIRSLDEPSL